MGRKGGRGYSHPTLSARVGIVSCVEIDFLATTRHGSLPGCRSSTRRPSRGFTSMVFPSKNTTRAHITWGKLMDAKPCWIVQLLAIGVGAPGISHIDNSRSTQSHRGCVCYFIWPLLDVRAQALIPSCTACVGSIFRVCKDRSLSLAPDTIHKYRQDCRRLLGAETDSDENPVSYQSHRISRWPIRWLETAR